jgi:sulfate adenylyltransferase subunit 1
MTVDMMTTPQHNDSLLRFMTCGSVDDGKSTLIGRLLFDTKTILADTLTQMEKTSKKRGMEAVDLSLLTDGLQAEREQGITIDVAYRYFSTGTRKYIIADAPGHEQYTRNMVTAASTANLAIILIDARKGVLTQTRRHSYLAHLVGIPHIVVAVNKMDLVGYDQAVFERIRADYLAFAEQIGLQRAGHDITFIPLSALNGDMIVDRGEGMDWYTGPTLIDLLEAVPAAHSEQSEDFRFPVQFVCRPHASDDPELHDFRGFMGKVESGDIAVGDAVTALPSGQTSTVKAIQLGAEQLQQAITEQSVTLLLEDEIDISRGDMIVKTGAAPEPVKQIEAFVCWLSETPLSPARTYIIRHTTRESKAKVGEIAYKVDVNTLEQLPTQGLAMNDIARISFRLAQPLMVDAYSRNRATGAFIVIDESTNNTVGAGMITS